MLKLCLLTAAILNRDRDPLSGQFSKLCPVTLTSIQDGHLQQTYCSFNIGPYGKNVLESSPLKLISQYSKHVILC
jgi:hypothetical protein